MFFQCGEQTAKVNPSMLYNVNRPNTTQIHENICFSKGEYLNPHISCKLEEIFYAQVKRNIFRRDVAFKSQDAFSSSTIIHQLLTPLLLPAREHDQEWRYKMCQFWWKTFISRIVPFWCVIWLSCQRVSLAVCALVSLFLVGGRGGECEVEKATLIMVETTSMGLSRLSQTLIYMAVPSFLNMR